MIKIRKMCIEDAQGIINILNPIIERGYSTVFDAPFSLGEERAFLKSFPDRGVFNIAENQNGHILGFQVLESFVTFARSMDHVACIGTYVDINSHGKGVGKLLSQNTFNEARAIGFEKIFSYVLEANKMALSFYTSLGFEVVGKAKQQVKLKNEYLDELLIEKFL
ncbi:MAG: GNAT family N-acetyltransferase [Bacteriovoracaceae bacterium]|nr:GNAT family N-acetyltransferase [Bacteriovoracaceae bacterium]